jgi:50S ribosomal subunit-associated GTPase HflX
MPLEAEMIPIVIVGNKIDLIEDTGELVSRDLVNEYTSAHRLPPPIMTSAKTGANISNVFHFVATELYKRHVHKAPSNPGKGGNNEGRSSCCASRKSEENQSKNSLKVRL